MEHLRLRLTASLIVASFLVAQTLAAPSCCCKSEIKNQPPGIHISKMHVKSNIRNRYAHTTVTSNMKNCGTTAKEATFQVVIPETAFISSFVMEVAGKNYTAYVAEKDKAKQDYQMALAKGLGAAHVAVSVRDSNRIEVSANVEPETSAIFYLTYEELLSRKDGLYEVVINIYPGQPVEDLTVEVEIRESRKITLLETPDIRSGYLIEPRMGGLEPGAYKRFISDTHVQVAFSPSLERQKQFANILISEDDKGFAGQFVVQYDVERDPKGGEVLVQDGYFVHFFAPSNLARLPKHVVFVLDTSSSMSWYGKIDQLKNAMYEILDQLHPDDLFHIVEFNTDVKIWVLDESPYRVSYSVDNMEKIMKDFHLHGAYAATQSNIAKAKMALSQFRGTSMTNIYASLRIGLYLVQITKLLNTASFNHMPMVIFLTDGDPTVGEQSTQKIAKDITRFNTGLRKTPIFALSFGDDADRNFLQKLSQSNAGFPRHIYQATDAALQLTDFYHQISSPELANVVFRYEASASNVTDTEFPLHFHGSELVIAGRCGTDMKAPVVEAWNGDEDLSFKPTVHGSVSSLERLWAYLTVKQLLEKKDVTDVEQQERQRKAVELSLKYSFVTPVTSLVVVKPETVTTVDPQVPHNIDPRIFTETETTDAPGEKGLVQFSAVNTVMFDVQSVPTLDFNMRFDMNSDIPLVPLFDNSTLLKNLVDNEQLMLPQGSYKLGQGETIRDTEGCANSILNSDGHCRLLHSCLADDGLSMRYDDFADHFCVLKGGYAGICCPDDWYKE